MARHAFARKHWMLLVLAIAAGSAAPSGTKSEKPDLTAEESDYSKQFEGPGYEYFPPPSFHDHRWTSLRPSPPDPYLTHHNTAHYQQFSGQIDPYILYVFQRYARFLPPGLGPYGIYGSTGLPKIRPRNYHLQRVDKET